MRDQIVALIENVGVTHFITGMALGVDIYAAEIVLDLKSKYPHITLELSLIHIFSGQIQNARHGVVRKETHEEIHRC